MKSINVTPQTAPMLTAHQQVALAFTRRLIQPVLRSFVNNAFADKDTHRNGAKDACHILDARYEPGKLCSILYKIGEQMIIGELTWPSTGETASGFAPLLSTMRLYPIERDPNLPTLPTAMDGNAMLRLFNATLPECAAGLQRILGCQVRLLRYRLGKRCTLRYDLRMRNTRCGTITKRTLYGKLYHSADKAEAVYHEMQMLTAVTEPNRLVLATAAAYLPTLPMVLQAPIETNVPLELLLQHQPSTQKTQLIPVIAGIRCAATALADLHQSSVRTERLRPVDAELKKLAQRCRQIAEVDIISGTDLHQLAQALLSKQAQLPVWQEEVALVHGDCKPSQFFLLPDGKVVLLDFDHCGMADPAADVGNFLATLRQMGIKQTLKQDDPTIAAAWQQWLATLENAFLDEYIASRACSSDFRQRAIWYQAMALLRKALRSYARSFHSPLPSLLVREAWHVLEAC